MVRGKVATAVQLDASAIASNGQKRRLLRNQMNANVIATAVSIKNTHAMAISAPAA